jgi:GMP synthase-like glutamine amidotransferase
MDGQKTPSLKVLVLDHTREPASFGSSNIVHWVLKTAPAGSEVVVRRPPDGDLPEVSSALVQGCDAIILSGSITSCMEVKEPWIRPLDLFIQQQIAHSKPMLGICYGHQAIARSLFEMAGRTPMLGKSAHPELGWQKIETTQATPLLEGLQKSFYTYESHYEEVSELPPQALGFARSEYCETQGFQVQGKPIFGVQFHPEYSIEEAERSLANKIKKGERKDWILNPGQGVKLYNDAVGKTIFGNFFKIASQRKA